MSLESRIAKLEASDSRSPDGPWGWVIVSAWETQEEATARTYPEGAPANLVVWNIVECPPRVPGGLL